jgi:hypothetical protein
VERRKIEGIKPIQDVIHTYTYIHGNAIMKIPV